MDDKQAFYVESTDGRKFKMVIRGDLGKLSVAKIRRYLKNYGVPDNQEILAGALVLEDDMLGEHFGLQNEGVLHLRDPIPPTTTMGGSHPASNSSNPVATAAAAAEVGRPPQGPRPLSGTAASPLAMSGSNYQLESSTGPSRNHSDATALQQQLRDVQRALEETRARNAELESQLAQARRSTSGASKQAGGSGDGLATAKASLSHLANELGVSLQFDNNLTCVVGTDEDFSLLLTYDPATERLYLYSTLLTELPSDPQVRMKLYEVLLEGSLLGREVCGGGIGVSTKNGVVVLTTSLPVKSCQPSALCEVMPAFVETLGRWRDLVMELIQ